ncbi:peptidoglycan/xylan/chitin deacetylase (PgdA/CDA1 family) [Novosphingobium sp. PhB165]|uniref:polysaccharide deacetylase family protein n=1 Tax=Novosphingobium sp. PhB165 TaxID=2485105 RepID=UPI0010E47A21|nr:polysaccharide deacetylase family protein [Novosphingobium sp. PhB165]TCM20516.1 peptidoglycan/xylan/chitin deacetylase (PgdA/CDA1 family) [Novosphingobium sp. PhB165]
MARRSARLLMAALLAAIPLPALADAAPQIALTFDDIPAHSLLPPGETRVAVIDRIIAELKAARAPAFGFANAGKGEPGELDAVLARWSEAGLPFGNHGYNHLNLDAVGEPTFVAEIDRNDAELAPRGMKRWFRYPFLAEGKNPAVRDAVRKALADRHYHIAGVSLSFDDWAWNEPYSRCATQGNQSAIADLETRYLDAARADAEAARAASKARFGRDVPYVLLLHIGAFDARMLPRLLDLYRGMGFQFITLEQAQRDKFYAATDPREPGPTPALLRTTPLPPKPGAEVCSR